MAEARGRDENLERAGASSPPVSPASLSTSANASAPGAGRPGSLDFVSLLPREEYVEQAHLFEVLAARMRENMPAQEILETVREEILVTTKLPMAVDFMLAELRHLGAFATAMERLPHYFTPFQAFVMAEAENDRQRFDIRVALEILRREAAYRAEGASRQGLFLYQLEVLCRNRMGYDTGLDAVAKDPAFDAGWRTWIQTVRRQIGIIELADLLFVRSEFYHERKAAEQGNPGLIATLIAEATEQGFPPLFGRQEGRIAWANRQKDPLLLFAALHRQLGYPEAPRPERENPEERLLPVLARRVEQLEARLKLVEEEQRGGIDLNRFYKPTDFDEVKKET